MVRLEIKELFTDSVGTRVSLQAPCSAAEDTEIFASVRIGGAMLDRKYAYLSLPRIIGKAEVFFGEMSLGEISDTEKKSVDIKPLLSFGEKEIRIKLYKGTILTGYPELLFFNTAAIEALHISERYDGSSVVLDIKLRTVGSSDGVKAIATLVSEAGQIYYGGITRGYGSIKVKDPLYWWPRGLGVQNLYRLTVNLYGESDIEDTEEISVGLRSAAVLRDGGVSLSFNELPFVPMGAKYQPPATENIREKLGEELKYLTRGGLNSVFLSADTAYVPSELMDFCDREGIVVIRELCEGDGVKAELDSLSDHPSLSYLIVPDGESADAIYTAARGGAPDAAIIIGGECDGALVEGLSSLPVDKTLSALGNERERNPLSNKVLSLGSDAYRDMLLRVADEYLFPSGPAELGYLTRLLQAKDAEEKIAEARLLHGEGLRFGVYSSLCDRVCAPSAAAVDSFGRKKLVYYGLSRASSPVYAFARRTEVGADITVINYRRKELSGRFFFRVIDSKNNLVYNFSEEISVPAVSEYTLSQDLTDYIAGRERECYLEYGISSYDAQYSGTLLFVKAKDFLFEIPTVKVRVDGEGEDFFITVSADKYTAGVEIEADSSDLELSDNAFDITSPAPVKLSARLKSGRLSAEELESRIKVNCLNFVGL